MFTGVIKLAAIDDYIAPSQECVKPLIEKAQGPLKANKNGEGPAKATVTLNDCLACSGCVTSAETVLIQQMSVKEFLSKAKVRKTAVFISPQSRASLAHHFKISQHHLLSSLSFFFKKHFNISLVLDLQPAIEICHSQIVHEFLSKPLLPILCSECPGWVCYAQKVAPIEVIPHMSKVKSPQQIMGSLVREKFKDVEYVVGVMPCYDKKLEAIRFQAQNGIKEVDLVLASLQIVDLIEKVEKGCSCGGNSADCKCKSQQKEETDYFPYKNAELIQMSKFNINQSGSKQLFRVKDPKSNGYLHVLLNQLKIQDYKTKQIRNSDLIEYEFTLDNQTVKMAQCYGFRNIQNIVRNIKNKKCDYAYIEIMACPTGCFNGGGQIKDPSIKPKQLAISLQAQTNKECAQQQHKILYEKNQKYLAEYKSIEKSASQVLLNW